MIIFQFRFLDHLDFSANFYVLLTVRVTVACKRSLCNTFVKSTVLALVLIISLRLDRLNPSFSSVLNLDTTDSCLNKKRSLFHR